MDWRTLAAAVVVETGLLALAAFGGPHGELGAWPWILQLPSIAFVLYPPGGEYFGPRVAIGAALQAGLWYLLIRAFRRRRRTRP